MSDATALHPMRPDLRPGGADAAAVADHVDELPPLWERAGAEPADPAAPERHRGALGRGRAGSRPAHLSSARRPPALWRSAAVRTGPRSGQRRFAAPLQVPLPSHGWLVCEEVAPAVPESVGRLRRALDRSLTVLGTAPMRRADVALLVSEAATDAVAHAYGGAEPGPLYLLAGRSGRDLVVTICDWGPGLRDERDRAALGRRLALVDRLADAVAVSANASGVGTRFSATFRDAIPDDLPEE
jgi:anti-sigma regulatory factor (Ser/Thr protein kinase)